MIHSPDANQTVTASGTPATRVLGVPVSTVNMPQAIAVVLSWLRAGKAHYICVRDVHGIMRAQDETELLEIHDHAGLVTPDGMPLVWLARWRGHGHVGRVCGADLVAELCAASIEHGIGHYFYGGKPGVAERMAAALMARFPGLKVVGTNTPPFGAMSAEEDAAHTAEITASGAGIVWVGLSTPKQEYWMRDHVDRIPGATLIGVGAAFDFYAGDVKRAPEWMHHRGLEWLHRLASEPRRLWRRYLVLAPKFVLMVGRRGLGRGA
ncbi:WecB/TagA/CpsF family glycosyltransferase [Sphingomonas sp. IC-11]|uniref:WecB/TagA/CpsF family glycosyltransferase n=1 Tax=Sphingomonas sp. IC-11 TaxID=2898528 RepID=UPI001E40EC24|nr:WecB/TagA/CpsF family glycosyltransferase [Sphingomonas sp. IC-11]